MLFLLFATCRDIALWSHADVLVNTILRHVAFGLNLVVFKQLFPICICFSYEEAEQTAV